MVLIQLFLKKFLKYKRFINKIAIIDYMKHKRKSFMHSYWKKSKKEEEESPVSERAKLLEKIRAKMRRREEKTKKHIFQKEPEKEEAESLDKLKKILGYDIEEERSTAERGKGIGKRKLTKEEVKERKKKALEEKDKLSSRDILKQKIKDLEEQISKTKYNKKTQHAIGLMKGQLASLKAKLAGGSKKGGAGEGYAVKKSGDASVILLGFPSTGKSTLLNNITNANSEIGHYVFTTLTVIPGMLNYKQAKIQILDVPGVVEGAAKGTGRGKEVLQVIRNADLIVILIDAFKPQQKRLLEKEVYDSNMRVNTKKPDVKITKTAKDGIRIGRTIQTPELNDETVKGILNQFKIVNANVLIRDEINADQFIDVIEGNKTYIPAITVVNKIDLLTKEQLEKLRSYLKPDLCISAEKKEHLDALKELIFKKLSFIRVYMKEINKKPDLEEPMIMKSGDRLRTVCLKLHKDFIEKFKFARIWGKSVKFDGQKVLKLDHKLADKDILELHIK